MSRPHAVQFSGWKYEISPYDILVVSRSASQAEIRKAYKKRALETHPDKQYQWGATAEEGLIAEELFRQVTEAFELLNDENKRRIYDIHSRPQPKPVVRTDRTPPSVPPTDVRPSRETNAASNTPLPNPQPKSPTSPSTSPSTNDTPRTQERAEWLRKEQADHKAWKKDRTKSFSIPAPTPVPVLPSPSTPAPPVSRSKSHDRGMSYDNRSSASSPQDSVKQPKKEPPPHYNEWADRILAELYYMMPELTAKTKPTPQREAGAPSKMRTSSA